MRRRSIKELVDEKGTTGVEKRSYNRGGDGGGGDVKFMAAMVLIYVIKLVVSCERERVANGGGDNDGDDHYDNDGDNDENYSTIKRKSARGQMPLRPAVTLGWGAGVGHASRPFTVQFRSYGPFT